MKKSIMILACLLAVTGQVKAGRAPCSGSKGGVDHCVEGKFFCKDGSVSESTQVCSPSGTLQKVENKVKHGLSETKEKVDSEYSAAKEKDGKKLSESKEKADHMFSESKEKVSQKFSETKSHVSESVKEHAKFAKHEADKELSHQKENARVVKAKLVGSLTD